MRTAAQWCQILMECHVHAEVAGLWGNVFADVVQPGSFNKGDADLTDFLGQVLHESQGLSRLVENLDYSAERLSVVWPTRFPNRYAALPYAHNPQLLANQVYARRMGNRGPDDGWNYRGRGIIMITGRENYRTTGDLMGQDLIGLPGLLEQPRFALEACIAWWEDRIPDSMLGDPEKVCKRVNGGLVGLADREQLTALAGSALA